MSKRRRYKPEGAEAFFSKGKNKQYLEELRKATVMDYQAGTGSLREICSKYKIREKTQLRMWIFRTSRNKHTCRQVVQHFRQTLGLHLDF